MVCLLTASVIRPWMQSGVVSLGTMVSFNPKRTVLSVVRLSVAIAVLGPSAIWLFSIVNDLGNVWILSFEVSVMLKSLVSFVSLLGPMSLVGMSLESSVFLLVPLHIV